VIVLGILNLTPDSFSDGASYSSPLSALDAAKLMRDQGADLIDVGGESTRPGANPVPVEEELRRVNPVIELLAKHEIPFSIDTMKVAVAEAALNAGARVVNDVSGLRDPAMFDLVVNRSCGACVMHMQGSPANMQVAPSYTNVVDEVKNWLVTQSNRLVGAGLPTENIWIDPGFGFGKTADHNFLLLKTLRGLTTTPFAVMVGFSRKSMLNLDGLTSASDRLPAGISAQTIAQIAGAKIIRTHDVKATRQACDFVSKFQSSSILAP